MHVLSQHALLVTDHDQARHFYGGVLGCTEGHRTGARMDSDVFGHPVWPHPGLPRARARAGRVGEHRGLMPHFGLIPALPDAQALVGRLRETGTAFVLESRWRHAGQPVSPWGMFFCTLPCGNPTEVRGFASLDQVYAA